jgi:hypothetical protein
LLFLFLVLSSFSSSSRQHALMSEQEVNVGEDVPLVKWVNRPCLLLLLLSKWEVVDEHHKAALAWAAVVVDVEVAVPLLLLLLPASLADEWARRGCTHMRAAVVSKLWASCGQGCRSPLLLLPRRGAVAKMENHSLVVALLAKAAFPRSCKSIVQLGEQAKNLLGEQKFLPSLAQTASCTWRSKVESNELHDGFARPWKRSLRE